MAADEGFGTGGPADWVSKEQAGAETRPTVVSADTAEVDRSVVGSVETKDADITASLVATVTAERDVSVGSSLVGSAVARHDAGVSQAGAGAVIAGGDVEMTKSGAGVIVGQRMDIAGGGGGVIVASEAEVRNAFVGMLVTRRAEVTEGSRVLIDTKAALIMSAVVAAGFAAVIALMYGALGSLLEWVKQLAGRWRSAP